MVVLEAALDAWLRWAPRTPSFTTSHKIVRGQSPGDFQPSTLQKPTPRALLSIHASHNAWFKPKPREKSNTGRLAILIVDNIYGYKEGAPTIAAELILVIRKAGIEIEVLVTSTHFAEPPKSTAPIRGSLSLFPVPQVQTTDLLSCSVIPFPGRTYNLSSASEPNILVQYHPQVSVPGMRHLKKHEVTRVVK